MTERESQNVSPQFALVDNNPEEIPYEISVSPKKITGMYRDMGFTDHEINETQIVFKRKFRFHPMTMLFGGDVLGTFNPITKRTTIYTDWVDKWQSKKMETVERITNHDERWGYLGRRDRKKLQKTLVTKRLVKYLQSAPPERSIPFADNLIWNSHQRLLNGVVLHEETHRKDDKFKGGNWKTSWAAKIGAVFGTNFALGQIHELQSLTHNGIVDFFIRQGVILIAEISALYAEYKVDPMEKSANKFMNETMFDPKYQGMVNVYPKDSPDTTL